MKQLLQRLRARKPSSYQQKRNNEENWGLIANRLDKDADTLLDVACDTGFYTIKSAQQGLLSLGFDILEHSIENAYQTALNNKIENVGFMIKSLSPESVKRLPNFDIILCLSVYHHFFRLYGEDDAKDMLITLFTKANKQLFLQIPSKIGKYGVGFSVDFNESKDLIDKYVREIFANMDNCRITIVGKKKEKPPTEEYRYLFLIEKK